MCFFTAQEQLLSPGLCVFISSFLIHARQNLLQDLINDIGLIIHLIQLQCRPVGDEEAPNVVPELDQTIRGKQRRRKKKRGNSDLSFEFSARGTPNTKKGNYFPANPTFWMCLSSSAPTFLPPLDL